LFSQTEAANPISNQMDVLNKRHLPTFGNFFCPGIFLLLLLLLK
jgi:hypothetical protein